jgi:hypothetical protein
MYTGIFIDTATFSEKSRYIPSAVLGSGTQRSTCVISKVKRMPAKVTTSPDPAPFELALVSQLTRISGKIDDYFASSPETLHDEISRSYQQDAGNKEPGTPVRAVQPDLRPVSRYERRS